MVTRHCRRTLTWHSEIAMKCVGRGGLGRPRRSRSSRRPVACPSGASASESTAGAAAAPARGAAGTSVSTAVCPCWPVTSSALPHTAPEPALLPPLCSRRFPEPGRGFLRFACCGTDAALPPGARSSAAAAAAALPLATAAGWHPPTAAAWLGCSHSLGGLQGGTSGGLDRDASATAARLVIVMAP